MRRLHGSPHNKMIVLASCEEASIQIDVLRVEKHISRPRNASRRSIRAASNTDINLSRAEAAFQRAIVCLKVAKSVGRKNIVIRKIARRCGAVVILYEQIGEEPFIGRSFVLR